MKDWLARRKSMTQILSEIDLHTDEEQVARIRADMEDKSLGSRYIDLSKLQADQEQSKRHRLMPEYIEKFFVEAYQLVAGQGDARILRRDPDPSHARTDHQGEICPQVVAVPHQRVEQKDRQVRWSIAAVAVR